MRKQSWTAHPVVGVLVGFGFSALYITFETWISPRAELLLGDWWPRFKPLLFFVFLGALAKMMLLRGIARTYRIEPMTPEAFAGLSLDQMQSVRVAPPLPSVVPDESQSKSAKKPSGALPLDWYQIENRTRELRELGFVLQIEGAMRTDREKSIPAFVRVLSHASGSSAKVFQLFPRGRAAMPVVLSFATYFEDGWLISDNTIKGNWAMWMMRRPRALGKRHEETNPAFAMWQAHRARCERVANELGVRVAPFSLDAYFQHAETELRETRSLVLRRSILVAMIQARFFRPRNGEWWGDFERIVQARKQHGEMQTVKNT